MRYLPTVDGVNVDDEVSGWMSTLDELAERIDTFEHRVKFMLEEGSRFRGYQDLARGAAAAPPSLGYRIVRIVNVYEPMPQGFEVPWNEGWYRPDYDQILNRFDARSWVEEIGVKEFWIWGYHYGGIEPAESNMSSPVTGDVSNSEGREDDLPIFRRTYTYPWPTRGAEGVPQQTESQFYLYWMQNMPGRGNAIPYQNEAMTNWWFFTADWDEAMRLGFGLHGPVNSPPPLIFRDDFEYGDVELWNTSVGLVSPDPLEVLRASN